MKIRLDQRNTRCHANESYCNVITIEFIKSRASSKTINDEEECKKSKIELAHKVRFWVEKGAIKHNLGQLHAHVLILSIEALKSISNYYSSIFK